jgi:hypothetical protein
MNTLNNLSTEVLSMVRRQAMDDVLAHWNPSYVPSYDTPTSALDAEGRKAGVDRETDGGGTVEQPTPAGDYFEICALGASLGPRPGPLQGSRHDLEGGAHRYLRWWSVLRFAAQLRERSCRVERRVPR